jgi:hypothetical protein
MPVGATTASVQWCIGQPCCLIMRNMLPTRTNGSAGLFTNTKGDPPALPGRQSKFDISGIGPGYPSVKLQSVSRQSTLSWEQDDSGSSDICCFAGGWPGSEKERREVCVGQAAAISVVGVAGHAGISYRRPGQMKT